MNLLRILRPTLLAMLFAAPFAQAQQQTAEELAIPRINLELFKTLHAAGRIVVIDVRSPQVYNQGHIPGAISVAVDTVPGRAAELRKHRKPIVAYCT
jgi:3-mercaptopyruvate sulfurtransferase SseA